MMNAVPSTITIIQSSLFNIFSHMSHSDFETCLIHRNCFQELVKVIVACPGKQEFLFTVNQGCKILTVHRVHLRHAQGSRRFLQYSHVPLVMFSCCAHNRIGGHEQLLQFIIMEECYVKSGAELIVNRRFHSPPVCRLRVPEKDVPCIRIVHIRRTSALPWH